MIHEEFLHEIHDELEKLGTDFFLTHITIPELIESLEWLIIKLKGGTK